MLGEMARKADDLAGEIHHLHDVLVAGVEPRASHILRIGRTGMAAPACAGKRGNRILGKTEDLAYLADCRFRAVGDDGCRKAGFLPPVFPVDVLDDLLAPLMLEVDIDVGRLVALLGDEALEQKIDLARIDLGDAKTVTDGGIGRRSPPLTENFLAAGKADDVVNRQEIRRVVELADQRSFMGDCREHFLRRATGIAPFQADGGQPFQRFLRGKRLVTQFLKDRIIGILVGQFVEGKADAGKQSHGLVDSFLIAFEQPQHFARRLQMALGIGKQFHADGGKGFVLANAGHNVLQRTALMHVIEYVADGKQRRCHLSRHFCHGREMTLVVCAMATAESKVDMAGERQA